MKKVINVFFLFYVTIIDVQTGIRWSNKQAPLDDDHIHEYHTCLKYHHLKFSTHFYIYICYTAIAFYKTRTALAVGMSTPGTRALAHWYRHIMCLMGNVYEKPLSHTWRNNTMFPIKWKVIVCFSFFFCSVSNHVFHSHLDKRSTIIKVMECTIKLIDSSPSERARKTEINKRKKKMNWKI